MARKGSGRQIAKNYLSDTESEGDSRTEIDSLSTDASDTDITEPEGYSLNQDCALDQLSDSGRGMPVETYRRRYKDPDDSTEDELSDIPSDFDEPKGTNNLRTRVVDRWHRYAPLNIGPFFPPSP